MQARPPSDVAALAEMCGCRVVAFQRQLSGAVAVRIECPSAQAKLDLLIALGRYDGLHFPDLTTVARRIVAPVGDDDAARLEAIQRWVQQHVGFCNEGQETFPTALRVLLDGIGDCDDHAILVIALLTALDYASTAEAFPAADPGHVAALGRLDGRWCWLETTVPARLGEHPLDACRRLGIETRKDIHV